MRLWQREMAIQAAIMNSQFLNSVFLARSWIMRWKRVWKGVSWVRWTAGVTSRRPLETCLASSTRLPATSNLHWTNLSSPRGKSTTESTCRSRLRGARESSRQGPHRFRSHVRGKARPKPQQATSPAKRHPRRMGCRPACKARVWLPSSTRRRMHEERGPRSPRCGIETSSILLHGAGQQLQSYIYFWHVFSKTWSKGLRKQQSSVELLGPDYSNMVSEQKLFHTAPIRIQQEVTVGPEPYDSHHFVSGGFCTLNLGALVAAPPKSQEETCGQYRYSQIFIPTQTFLAACLWNRARHVHLPFQTTSQTAPHLQSPTILWTDTTEGAFLLFKPEILHWNKNTYAFFSTVWQRTLPTCNCPIILKHLTQNQLRVSCLMG